MASPFDDLDRKKLDETHKLCLLLVQQVARMDEKFIKFLKHKSDNAWGRRYLRGTIRKLREELSNVKSYNKQLENELRLRGLE